MRMNGSIQLARFNEAVDIIRQMFPELVLHVQEQPLHVDAAVDIPEQPTLDFRVHINLQKDEIHLLVGAFEVEWFPCSDREVFGQFLEATKGLLSGSFRIVEYYVAGFAVKAKLQKPDDGDWETVAVWSNLGVLIPLPRTRCVLRNKRKPEPT